MNTSTTFPQDTKKVFRKCGTCSQTFCHLLNREFGHPSEMEERAIDPLAGGILNRGHQCGMLWGAALAVGAEAYRKYENSDEAITAAIKTSQDLIESFLKETNTVSCREITGYNLNSFFGLARYMLKVTLQGIDNSRCFNLAEQWAPEAIESAKRGLSSEQTYANQQAVSCATEVAKRMGASDKEMVMVAGFAGGLGLSGNACGALSAAIWMNTLTWCKNNPGKTPPYLKNPRSKKLVEAFLKVTDSEMQCSAITGQSFKTVEEHTEYIKNGGCKKVVELLANHEY